LLISLPFEFFDERMDQDHALQTTDSESWSTGMDDSVLNCIQLSFHLWTLFTEHKAMETPVATAYFAHELVHNAPVHSNSNSQIRGPKNKQTTFACQPHKLSSTVSSSSIASANGKAMDQALHRKGKQSKGQRDEAVVLSRSGRRWFADIFHDLQNLETKIWQKLSHSGRDGGGKQESSNALCPGSTGKCSGRPSTHAKAAFAETIEGGTQLVQQQHSVAKLSESSSSSTLPEFLDNQMPSAVEGKTKSVSVSSLPVLVARKPNALTKKSLSLSTEIQRPQVSRNQESSKPSSNHQTSPQPQLRPQLDRKQQSRECIVHPENGGQEEPDSAVPVANRSTSFTRRNKQVNQEWFEDTTKQLRSIEEKLEEMRQKPHKHS
jgi:hypothetical protein